MRIPPVFHVLAAGTLAVAFPLPASETATTEPIRLELSVAKSETLQCEPVVTEVKIVNDSHEKQWIEGALEPEWKRLLYYIVDPFGKRLTYDPIVHVDGGAARIPLAPGERVTIRQMLLYSTTPGQLFRHPGEYSLEAALHRPTENLPQTLRSNTVVLTVRLAAGIDVEALEHFGGNPQALFGIGMTRDWAIADEFRWIVREYPKSAKSAYFPWCLYFLGNYLPRDPSRAEIKAQTPSRNLGMLVSEYPDFPMVVEARYQLAKQLLRLGRTNDALARMNELFRADPDLLLFRRAKEQIENHQRRGLPVPVESLP